MGTPGPPGPPGELPLLPPELLFQRDNPSKGRTRRDTGGVIDDIQDRYKRAAAVKSDDSKEDLNTKLLDMYSSIYTMRQDLERIKKPQGSKENPVRSCKDLYFGHPQFKDGWYWIDPNLGMPDDAIYVYCNMSGSGETCVFPDLQSSKMPNIPWRKTGDKLEWYSQMRGASKITYETVGVVQMTFLRLLSQNAYQNITFTCVNSAMWYNQRTFKYDQAIKLLGDNEQEFSAQGVRPNVIIDGCKNRKGKSQTVFEIRSEKLGQLPIIDFFPVDYGLPHQAFGFEVGPACFK